MKRGLKFIILSFLAFVLLLLAIVNSASSFDSNFGELKVTLEHPFYVNHSWVKAGQLVPGDILTTFNGGKVRIISIEDVSENVTVFNLHVDKFNNYFANNVLVHNKPTQFQNVRTESIELAETEVLQGRVTQTTSIFYAIDVDDPVSFNFLNRRVGVSPETSVHMRGFKGVYHKSGTGRLFPSTAGPNAPHHTDVMIDILKEVYPDFPQTNAALTRKYPDGIWKGVIQDYGSEFTGWEFYQTYGPGSSGPLFPRMSAEMDSYISLEQLGLQIPIKESFLQDSIQWATTRKMEGSCPGIMLSPRTSVQNLHSNWNIVP